MNKENYTTLEQSKKLKEFGFPQDKTDCVWIKLKSGWSDSPVLREQLTFHLDGIVFFTKIEGMSSHCEQVIEWYAAPSAQEIELDEPIESDGTSVYKPNFNFPMEDAEYILIGKIHHAQARAAAKIWELEKKASAE